MLGRMLGGGLWLGQALFAPWTLHPRLGFSQTEQSEPPASLEDTFIRQERRKRYCLGRKFFYISKKLRDLKILTKLSLAYYFMKRFC